MTAITPRYLNAEQAVIYLGFTSIHAIRQLVHKREIPHFKVGARVRFDRLELDSWRYEAYLTVQFLRGLDIESLLRRHQIRSGSAPDS